MYTTYIGRFILHIYNDLNLYLVYRLLTNLQDFIIT